MLSRHGTNAIAAAAAAGKVGMLISLVQMGVCMGVQPLMAYHYGAANLSKLKDVIKKTFLLTSCIGIGTMVICFILRQPVIGLFLKEEEVAVMGVKYLQFTMAGAPFLGLVYLSTNFLQAAKKAAAAIIVSLLRQGLLLILLHQLFGLYGLAAAHMVADMAAAVTAAIIFLIYCRQTTKEFA